MTAVYAPPLFELAEPGPAVAPWQPRASLGADVADWAEAELVQFEGPRRGEPLRLFPWQRRATRGAFESATSALSVPRSAGKSHVVGVWAAARVHPGGPAHQAEAQAIAVAGRFDQAVSTIGRKVQALLRPTIERHPRDWRVRDSGVSMFQIEHLPTRSRFRALSADPAGMHGEGALWLCDEVARWKATKSDAAIAAILSAGGKLGDERVAAISTMPSDPGHWFSRAVLGGWDYQQLHRAGEHDPVFRERTWRKANPSLRYRPELLADYRASARRARSDPAEMRQFESLKLNKGLSEVRTAEFIEAARWLAAEGDAGADGGHVLAFDLATTGMAAAAAFWPDTGRLDALGFFPELPGLARRGLAEGVGDRFLAMAARGELQTAGREAIDVGQVLDQVRARWGMPEALVCDSWRRADLTDALHGRGWPRLPLILRRNGFGDGDADTRAFERALYAGRVVPVESLLLRHALAGCELAFDAAGNQRLTVDRGPSGKRAKHRDDAIAASVLAVAAAVRAGRVPGLTEERAA